MNIIPIDESYVADMMLKLNSKYKLGYTIPFYAAEIDGKYEAFILSTEFNTIFDDSPSYQLLFMRNTVITLDPSLSTEYAAGIIAATVNYILGKIDSYNNSIKMEDENDG